MHRLILIYTNLIQFQTEFLKLNADLKPKKDNQEKVDCLLLFTPVFFMTRIFSCIHSNEGYYLLHWMSMEFYNTLAYLTNNP